MALGTGATGAFVNDDDMWHLLHQVRKIPLPNAAAEFWFLKFINNQFPRPVTRREIECGECLSFLNTENRLSHILQTSTMLVRGEGRTVEH